MAKLQECTAGAADTLPSDYGDPDGLWVTVRSRNPFRILMLDPGASPSPDALLVRFRVLWKFWTQKSTIARQGATRAVIRQKYGESIDSYIDNLQWAYDQLSTTEGVRFWRTTMQQQRAQMLWARVEPIIDAALADGMLEIDETRHLISRAEYAGYEREEFAGTLRSVLHARGFDSESALRGSTESDRLSSARWATADVWTRIRAAKAAVVPVTLYYVHARQTVFGPMTAVQVEELIRERRVNQGDGVCIAGAPVWQPIEQSQFAHHFRGPATPCPRCGHALVIVTSSVMPGVLVLILGVVTAILYIGFVFIVIGIVMMIAAAQTRWRCTQCRYSS
ncbi:MAG TPA: hypothetical protein VHL59_14105 [Thermoanaerobaculia bacterium]|nr:hypothetical protein [Thermoanaerobaculia bacterium]